MGRVGPEDPAGLGPGGFDSFGLGAAFTDFLGFLALIITFSTNFIASVYEQGEKYNETNLCAC